MKHRKGSMSVAVVLWQRHALAPRLTAEPYWPFRGSGRLCWLVSPDCPLGKPESEPSIALCG